MKTSLLLGDVSWPYLGSVQQILLSSEVPPREKGVSSALSLTCGGLAPLSLLVIMCDKFKGLPWLTLSLPGFNGGPCRPL